MPEAFDRDAFLRDYQPSVVEVRIVMAGALLLVHQKLEEELTGARAAASGVMFDAEVTELGRRVRELEAEIAESERVYTFRGVSHREWQDLIRAHPPTDKQRKELPELDHNPETFHLAAIAASSHDPQLTPDDVQFLRDNLVFTEFEKLWGGALEANLGVVASPKSLLAAAIDVVSQNGGSSTTARQEASPGASS